MSTPTQTPQPQRFFSRSNNNNNNSAKQRPLLSGHQLSAASNPDLGSSYASSSGAGAGAGAGAQSQSHFQSGPGSSASGGATPGPSGLGRLGLGGIAREAVARKASLNQLTSNSNSERGGGAGGAGGEHAFGGRYGLAAVRDDDEGTSRRGSEAGSPSSFALSRLGGSTAGVGTPARLNSQSQNRRTDNNNERNGMAPVTPGAKMATTGTVRRESADVEVGDTVDVPGAMHGTVKFIGSVKGKAGVFAGVELSREFAPRGKNDGDVEGTRYFTTAVPNSGIFLPLNRAAKRASPTLSSGSFPPTPSTPSFAAFNLGNASDKHGSASNKTFTPPTPSVPKLSQSVGPGARASSPQFKPKSRPSLPRPESPSRRLGTPVARPSLGAPSSTRNGPAGATPRYAPSPTPGKFGASMKDRRGSAAGDPGKRMGFTPRPGARTPGGGSRAASALSMRSDYDEQDEDTTPVGTARTYDANQVATLRKELAQRDKQLKNQSTSLQEMEKSFAELQSLLPAEGLRAGAARGGNNNNRGSGSGSGSQEDVSQLRTLIREKNEKISLLTAEFDAHRADFRSTIDTLEMASTETERVYEKRIEDLLQEVRDLQDRGEDVESVARQLKQLEELVQELEEGLEDARRGEAEARGEVEFLRGEVERGRSELRREREKAAAALKGAGATVFDGGGTSPGGGAKEVEQRDDEIRGLKAIIHLLSRDAVPDVGSPNSNANGTPRSRNPRQNSFNNNSNKTPNGGSTSKRSSMQLVEERLVREKLEREVKELQGLVERKAFKEEELERELDRLRGAPSSGARPTSDTTAPARSIERTITPSRRSSTRDSKGTVQSYRDRDSDPPSSAYRPSHAHALETMPESSSDHASSDLDTNGRGPPRGAAGGGGGGGSGLWCEICETEGHDILTCTNMFGSAPGAVTAPTLTPTPTRQTQQTPQNHTKSGSGGSAGNGYSATLSPRAEDRIAPLSPGRRSPAPPAAAGPTSPPTQPTQPTASSPAVPMPKMPNPSDVGMVAGKASGAIDPERWCALCERDGHESVDCPFEDAF